MSSKKKGGKVKENKPKKVAVDATFGMKNKNKSKKVQQFAKQMQQNQANAGISKAEQKRREQLRLEKEARQAQKQFKEEQRALIKPVLSAGGAAAAAAAPGGDPKDSICKFFLQGGCARGDKCKFSHSVGADNRQQKLNLYVDPRDQDTMENWDQAKLEQVVREKDEKNRRPNQTEIVCKYFLDAIANNKYGHFWKCPNGDNCIYRHRLPQGYVFRPKGQKVQDEDKEEEVPLEIRIEEERAKLDLAKCTPVTEQTFTAWFSKQQKKRKDKIEAERKQAAKKSGNRGLNVLSGHAMFHFDRALFENEDEEGQVDDYKFDDDDEDEEEPVQSASKNKEKKKSASKSTPSSSKPSSKTKDSGESAIPAGVSNPNVFLAEDFDDL